MPPVATLKPGDILETNTVDAFGNVIKKPGDTMAMVKGDNPLTGPFAIAGAEPGDTLVVKILDLTVDSTRGVGALAPGFGALNTTSYTPMLNANLPEKIWFYDIDAKANQATFHALDSTFSVKIPLQPFLGCIGVAPAGGEARSSVVPAEFGGNMDAPEVRPGYTLYLPVNAPGASALSRRRSRGAGRRRNCRHGDRSAAARSDCRWTWSKAGRSAGRVSRTRPA